MKAPFPYICDGCGCGMASRGVQGYPCDYTGPAQDGAQGAPSFVDRHWCSFDCLAGWRKGPRENFYGRL
jgi:hypothetical protein